MDRLPPLHGRRQILILRTLSPAPHIDADVISNAVSDTVNPKILFTEILQHSFLEEQICALFQEQLERKIMSNSPEAVVMSLRHVTHLTSTALGLIIRMRNELSGGMHTPSTLYLCEIPPDIMEVFDVTRGLRKHFNIFATREQAIEAARNANPNSPEMYAI